MRNLNPECQQNEIDISYHSLQYSPSHLVSITECVTFKFTECNWDSTVNPFFSVVVKTNLKSNSSCSFANITSSSQMGQILLPSKVVKLSKTLTFKTKRTVYVGLLFPDCT